MMLETLGEDKAAEKIERSEPPARKLDGEQSGRVGFTPPKRGVDATSRRDMTEQ